jgi:hypothetical protein
MTSKELKMKNPQIYADVIAEGVAQERARVAALVAKKRDPRFANIDAIQTVFDDAIERGDTVDQASARLLEVLSSNGVQAAMESPGAIETGSVDTATGEVQRSGAAGGIGEPITEV